MTSMTSWVLSVALCIFQIVTSSSGATWNTLNVTFGNPADTPTAFGALPRVMDGSNTEWTMVDNGCLDPSLYYKGKRYIKDSDHGMMLIFDKNGIVAGIQMAISKDIADQHKKDFVDYSKLPAAVPQTFGGKKYYVFTVYFVDPWTICTRGRTEKQLEEEGTGHSLYIQKGKLPLVNSLEQPMDGNTSPLLTKQNCMPMMGRHYFEGLDEGSNCKHIGPIFLLTDDVEKKLVAFGFITPGNYQSSRFEHPPLAVLGMFLNKVPKCVSDVYAKTGGVSSMHVYLRWPPVQKCVN